MKNLKKLNKSLSKPKQKVYKREVQTGSIVNYEKWMIKGDDNEFYFIKDYETTYSKGVTPASGFGIIGTRVKFELEGDLARVILEVNPSSQKCDCCTHLIELKRTEEEFLNIFNQIKEKVESSQLLVKENTKRSYNINEFKKLDSITYNFYYSFSFNEFYCKNCNAIISVTDCERSIYFGGLIYLKYPYSDFIE